MASKQAKKDAALKPQPSRTSFWGRVNKVITIHQAGRVIVQNYHSLAIVGFLGVCGLMGVSLYVGSRPGDVSSTTNITSNQTNTTNNQTNNFFDGSKQAGSASMMDVIQDFVINYPPPSSLDGSKSKSEEENNQRLLGKTRAAISRAPNNPIAQTNHGEILRRTGDLDGAKRAHERALQLKPGLPEAKLGLALVEQARGNSVEALLAIGEIAANGNSISSFFQGISLISRKEWESAEKEFRKAIALNEDWALTHIALGSVLYRQKRYGEAIASFKTAIQLDPNIALAYSNLGSSLGNQGRYDEAIDSFKTAIRINPNYVEAYMSLGTMLYVRGKYEEAVAVSKTVINLAPNNALTYKLLSASLYRQGKYEESITPSKTAIRLDPNDAEQDQLFLGLALLFKQPSDIPQGTIELRQARRLAIKQGNTATIQLVDRALVLVESGNIERLKLAHEIAFP
jgi:tetratricopeptide (TPR) repeat protein